MRRYPQIYPRQKSRIIEVRKFLTFLCYKQINKHTVAKAPRKDIYRYTYESKKGERTKYNLYVPEINKKEIDLLLRKKGK